MTAIDPPKTPVFVIEPYIDNDYWVFDDASVGLMKEPFMGAVNGMVDRLLPGGRPPDGEKVRLRFAAVPFEESRAVLRLDRVDPTEGYWYRDPETGVEGWLCPALLLYFPEPPAEIHCAVDSPL